MKQTKNQSTKMESKKNITNNNITMDHLETKSLKHVTFMIHECI